MKVFTKHMDQDAQLKLQAFLDGELPEAEAAEVARWLARDREAVALLGELRQTRQALAGFENGIRLPESREFYWSKIQRGIESLEAPAPKPAPPPLLARWLRFLAPAGALAGLVAAGLLAIHTHSGVTGMETAMLDTGAITYRDDDSGATVVWFSYPAENELAHNDADDTID